MAAKNNRQMEQFQMAFFSEKALVVLVSIVTLLLQLISFATTWNGSRIYLEGVFSHASLLFAIAVQAIAYFFSNSLRTRIRPLKVAALCAALCCSTYYSYIGIYNSVNSPVSYLQENYVRLSHELTHIYEENLEKNLSAAREAAGQAASLVTARYSSLLSDKQQYLDCRNALAEVEISYAGGLRAPRQSAYANYEDYAAAYQAYVNSISQSSNTENAAGREGVLSAYGFSSVEELSRLEAENLANLQALETALGGDNSVILDLSGKLNAAINAAAEGQSLDVENSENLNRMLQAAALCGYEGMSPAEVSSTLKLVADTTAGGFLSDYASLAASLPEGTVTDANIMSLKSAMDSELLAGLITLNSLLPDTEQLDFTSQDYQITDLYLVPVEAFQSQDTRTTAVFCLAVAALIDALSVLFAVSLREKKPLWKKHILLFGNLEDYAPYIYGALPGNPKDTLAAFMEHFRPSPRTEGDGYMMQAEMDALHGYETLAALLCQLNLAKIIPAGFLDNPSEVLLLKSRFILWVNSVIYEERTNDIKCGIKCMEDSAHEPTPLLKTY